MLHDIRVTPLRSGVKQSQKSSAVYKEKKVISVDENAYDAFGFALNFMLMRWMPRVPFTAVPRSQNAKQLFSPTNMMMRYYYPNLYDGKTWSVETHCPTFDEKTVRVCVSREKTTSTYIFP